MSLMHRGKRGGPICSSEVIYAVFYAENRKTCFPDSDDKDNTLYPTPQNDTPFTVIRVTIGSHESHDMGGSMPSFALFTEFGQRMAAWRTSNEKMTQGSFRDIVIEHGRGYENFKASYLLIHAGYEPICITSIGILFPDGTRQQFTGTDLAMCNRMDTRQSRTFIGVKAFQPQCFHLQGTANPGDQIVRMALHLPDWLWSPARERAVRRNKDILCRETPRFYLDSKPANWMWRSFDNPIPIFNPVIEYDPKTNFDKYPQQNLEWKRTPKIEYSNEWKGDYSDTQWHGRPPYVPSPRRSLEPAPRPSYHKPAPDLPYGPAFHPSPVAPPRVFPTPSGLGYRKRVAEASEYVQFNTDVNVNATIIEALPNPLLNNEPEEIRIRTQAPELVISHGAVSAQEMCLSGEWNHTDYVSLSEKIYCDMQSRSMFPFCHDEVLHNCWSRKTGKLQSFHADEPTAFQNKLAVGSAWDSTVSESIVRPTKQSMLWAPTGAMFGFAYPNVTLIG